MKNKMPMMLLMILFGLVFPSGALASDKILLFEDIRTEKASFTFEKGPKGGVLLIAKVRNNKCWDQDCEPYLLYWKRLPNNFSIQNLEVFYYWNGTPIHCGNVQGFLQSSQVLSTCKIEILQSSFCTSVNWYEHCDPALKYRVYMTIPFNDSQGSLNGQMTSDGFVNSTS